MCFVSVIQWKSLSRTQDISNIPFSRGRMSDGGGGGGGGSGGDVFDRLCHYYGNFLSQEDDDNMFTND